MASGLPAWPAVAPASSDAPLRREPRTIPASTTPSRTPNSLTVRSSPTGCPRPDSGAHGDLDRWHGRHLQRGRSAAADSETAGQKFCADAVRDCPQIPGATIALVRTYGGQRQVFTPYLRMFIKVSGYSDGLGGVGWAARRGSAFTSGELGPFPDGLPPNPACGFHRTGLSSVLCRMRDRVRVDVLVARRADNKRLAPHLRHEHGPRGLA